MRARCAWDSALNPRWAEAYSARPSGVSTRIGSYPQSWRSYGEARMSISRMRQASSKQSITSSLGSTGASL